MVASSVVDSNFSGRGSWVGDEGEKYVGYFKDGERHGRGTMWFPDGGFQSGRWKLGEMHGAGEYVDDEGCRIAGQFIDGALEGYVEELEPDGFVTYSGKYSGNLRHDTEGLLRFRDGGMIKGRFEHGALQGRAVYTYPDQQSTLVGEWRDDRLHAAVFISIGCKQQKLHADEALPYRQGKLAAQPLFADPYETARVYCSASPIDGAGDGLFARRRLEAGELCCWYNGIKLPLSIVDRRPWRLNSNCISLNNDYALDVPAEYADITQYCASLGHKVNHSFEPNTEYAPCFYPRFGHIKCIRALRSIDAGEELTVDYGFTNQAPQWWRALKKRRR